MFTNLDNETPVELGQKGEKIAQSYLSKTLGWKILASNVRNRYGELDIVAIDRGVYVFVEVKSRRSMRYGKPLEAVTPLKLARIKQQVDIYLHKHGISSDSVSVRIDVIGFAFSDGFVHFMQHETIVQ